MKKFLDALKSLSTKLPVLNKKGQAAGDPSRIRRALGWTGRKAKGAVKGVVKAPFRMARRVVRRGDNEDNRDYTNPDVFRQWFKEKIFTILKWVLIILTFLGVYIYTGWIDLALGITLIMIGLFFTPPFIGDRVGKPVRLFMIIIGAGSIFFFRVWPLLIGFILSFIPSITNFLATSSETTTKGVFSSSGILPNINEYMSQQQALWDLSSTEVRDEAPTTIVKISNLKATPTSGACFDLTTLFLSAVIENVGEEDITNARIGFKLGAGQTPLDHCGPIVAPTAPGYPGWWGGIGFSPEIIDPVTKKPTLEVYTRDPNDARSGYPVFVFKPNQVQLVYSESGKVLKSASELTQLLQPCINTALCYDAIYRIEDNKVDVLRQSEEPGNPYFCEKEINTLHKNQPITLTCDNVKVKKWIEEESSITCHVDAFVELSYHTRSLLGVQFIEEEYSLLKQPSYSTPSSITSTGGATLSIDAGAQPIIARENNQFAAIVQIISAGGGEISNIKDIFLFVPKVFGECLTEDYTCYPKYPENDPCPSFLEKEYYRNFKEECEALTSNGYILCKVNSNALKQYQRYACPLNIPKNLINNSLRTSYLFRSDAFYDYEIKQSVSVSAEACG